ncbi:hypothetical protein [Kineococcus sp. SYSU DK018]|uniref:hypothetical protein n=1 Tax=Kineococcus sp. SYSU DK018 TaxID=3383139 RepID=UPI003D7DA51C
MPEKTRVRTSLSGGEVADVLIHNGNIATMNQDFGYADAVAVSHGRIVGVGSAEDLRPLVGRRTELVDLGGRTAVPGFCDSHSHPYREALGESRVDLAPAGPSRTSSTGSRIGRRPCLPASGSRPASAGARTG